MSSTEKIQRDIREIIHDEFFMRDNIVKALKAGPLTISEIAEVIGYPRYEVEIWLFAMRRYGEVEVFGRPDVDGYFKYGLIKTLEKGT
jgi:hypothetical protein